MLHIERMRIQLPAGFEHRASTIARLVGDSMAEFHPSENRTLNRLSISPVQVSPNATDQEIPYSTAVEIEEFREQPGEKVYISATIHLERESQKGIVIGKNGSLLKKIGSQAREDIQHLIASKVYLQLWVKVREDWADDEQSLAAFGYSDANPSH